MDKKGINRTWKKWLNPTLSCCIFVFLQHQYYIYSSIYFSYNIMNNNNIV